MNTKLKALQKKILKKASKPSRQKFAVGDIVKVSITDPNRSHFTGFSQNEAVVVGSYYQQYGGDWRGVHEYTLAFPDGRQSSWYLESELSLL